MQVTIYHNPRCSKSRQALALIEQAGHQPAIVEYLKTPLTLADVTQLRDQLGVPVRDMMRTGEAVYKELNLKHQDDEAALLAALVAHPILLERPVIVSDRGAVIGRPPERVAEILG